MRWFLRRYPGNEATEVPARRCGEKGTYYGTVQILSPRLEIRTARRIELRRAVFRLSAAVYVRFTARRVQFNQPAKFGTAARRFAITCSQIASYRVQILSPLSRQSTDTDERSFRARRRAKSAAVCATAEVFAQSRISAALPS